MTTVLTPAIDSGARLLGNAAELVQRQVPLAATGSTVRDAVDALHGNEYASVTAVAVMNGERLAGLVRIEDLLRAPGETTIDSIMDAAPPVVSPDTDQEEAAWTASHTCSTRSRVQSSTWR